MEGTKPTVHITNWSIYGSRLYGFVVDHPRFDPNTEVITSTILGRPDEPVEGDIVETRNTIYILGKEKK